MAAVKPGWRQGKVYQFIRAYQLDHGHSPSIREIGDGVGLTSTSSVAWHLSQLELKGLVSREPGTRGTVTVNELVTVKRADLVSVLSEAEGFAGGPAFARLAAAAGMR